MSEPVSTQLPARPSLEQLRTQAKDLLRACRNADPVALERVRRHRTARTGQGDGPANCRPTVTPLNSVLAGTPCQDWD